MSVSAGTVLLLWTVGSPVMSGVLQVLDQSLYARKKNLNTVLLLAATVSGWGRRVKSRRRRSRRRGGGE